MSINTAHCSACGVDPFDKTYSIGYEVGHKDWSPYPRVNHLRKAILIKLKSCRTLSLSPMLSSI